jgi:hypothetical protein
MWKNWTAPFLSHLFLNIDLLPIFHREKDFHPKGLTGGMPGIDLKQMSLDLLNPCKHQKGVI